MCFSGVGVPRRTAYQYYASEYLGYNVATAGSNFGYTGQIKDYKSYNRALTDSEATQLCNNRYDESVGSDALTTHTNGRTYQSIYNHTIEKFSTAWYESYDFSGTVTTGTATASVMQIPTADDDLYYYNNRFTAGASTNRAGVTNVITDPDA